MVDAGFFDLFSLSLQFALGLQYYGFLAGAVLLGIVFIRMMSAEPAPQRSTRRARVRRHSTRIRARN